MAININGSGTITGVSVGGLPDGIVDTDMLATSAVTVPKIGYNGAILQVVPVTKTDTTSSSSTTYTDITGMSASITPVAASSKILVMMAVNIGVSGGSSGYGFVKLLRGSTDIFKGDSASSRTLCTIQLRAAGVSTGADIHYTSITQPITFLDTPTYTLSDTLTYKLQWKREADDIYLNRSASDGDNASQGRAASSIVLMEVSD